MIAGHNNAGITIFLRSSVRLGGMFLDCLVKKRLTGYSGTTGYYMQEGKDDREMWDVLLECKLPLLRLLLHGALW